MLHYLPFAAETEPRDGYNHEEEERRLCSFLAANNLSEYLDCLLEEEVDYLSLRHLGESLSTKSCK